MSLLYFAFVLLPLVLLAQSLIMGRRVDEPTELTFAASTRQAHGAGRVVLASPSAR